MKLLLKILIIFIGIIVLIAAVGYYSLFHTSLPAKAVFTLLEKTDTNWSFDDISGSLSKGLTIGTLTYKSPEDITKISTIKNLGFEYKKTSDTFAITELHLDSAYLYIDPKPDMENFSYQKTETTTESDYGDSNNGHLGGQEPILNSGKSNTPPFVDTLLKKKWLVKNVSIKDLTIEDPVTNEKTYIKEIISDGFIFTGGKILLGRLGISSNNLDLDIQPTGTLIENLYGSAIDIKGHVGEKLHWALKKDIDFTGFIDFTMQPFSLNEFSGLNGTIKIVNETDEIKKITFSDFSFDDYFLNDTVPPIKNVNLEGVYHIKDNEKTALEIFNGNLKMGETLFTIDHTTIDLKNEPNGNKALIAKAVTPGTTYTITITSEGNMAFTFSSVPEMSEEDIIAKLIYRKPFNSIEPDEKSGILKYLQ
jgi:hypothetical protein